MTVHPTMRRFTITVDDDTAEAVQFTNGLIYAWWQRTEQAYAWASLDAVHEQHPDAEIDWIDEEEPGA